MADTSIEWAEKVCLKVAAFAAFCAPKELPMSERILPHPTRIFDREWSVTHDDELAKPLHWKKPARIFVNSMSDLFHRDVPFDFIDRVFAVMALCPQHTFMVLTKRPERMAEYLNSRTAPDGRACDNIEEAANEITKWTRNCEHPWPLPNVWLGVSTENQQAADERLPHLLNCPAAVRFVSAEPLIGPVDLPLVEGEFICDSGGNVNDQDPPTLPGIDLVIVGGESGPNARPCNVEWIRDVVRQCKAAGVACFVKQLGSVPVLGESEPPFALNGPTLRLRDPKGGEPAEWPENLRVREMPTR